MPRRRHQTSKQRWTEREVDWWDTHLSPHLMKGSWPSRGECPLMEYRECVRYTLYVSDHIHAHLYFNMDLICSLLLSCRLKLKSMPRLARLFLNRLARCLKKLSPLGRCWPRCYPQRPGHPGSKERRLTEDCVSTYNEICYENLVSFMEAIFWIGPPLVCLV